MVSIQRDFTIPLCVNGLPDKQNVCKCLTSFVCPCLATGIVCFKTYKCRPCHEIFCPLLASTSYCCCYGISGYFRRRRVRVFLKSPISENFCTDCVFVHCCCCCSVYQEWKELDSYDVTENEGIDLQGPESEIMDKGEETEPSEVSETSQTSTHYPE